MGARNGADSNSSCSGLRDKGRRSERCLTQPEWRLIQPERRLTQPERCLTQPERRLTQPERRLTQPERRLSLPEPRLTQPEWRLTQLEWRLTQPEPTLAMSDPAPAAWLTQPEWTGAARPCAITSGTGGESGAFLPDHRPRHGAPGSATMGRRRARRTASGLCVGFMDRPDRAQDRR